MLGELPYAEVDRYEPDRYLYDWGDADVHAPGKLPPGRRLGLNLLKIDRSTGRLCWSIPCYEDVEVNHFFRLPSRILQHRINQDEVVDIVAVCLHGYQRNTNDVDIIIQPLDTSQVESLLIANGYEWDEPGKEFRSSSGSAIQFLMAGDKAGKGTEVLIPEPLGELNVEEREGLPVVRLSRLIEMKLASGIGNLRRTHRDFADVVELIAIQKLDGSYARHVHMSLRPTFRKLARNAQAE
ncbi:MAG: hypothetical protein R3E01_34470 [Pirellulaceae bacterium]|nr:hypothetical protein [Planctomycetales bacterium]